MYLLIKDKKPSYIVPTIGKNTEWDGSKIEAYSLEYTYFNCIQQ